MVLIKFLKPYNHYKEGEIAEFFKNDAHTLIDRGIATLVTATYNTRMLNADVTLSVESTTGFKRVYRKRTK